MKLRNKKTGEIAVIRETIHLTKENDICCGMGSYSSLAELSEEWEDYEEPKEDYLRVITSFIHYVEEADDSFYCDESVHKFVEKLKAWRRLKDKGFGFNGWNWKTQCIAYNLDYTDITEEQIEEAEKDLDLLFGGKE